MMEPSEIVRRLVHREPRTQTDLGWFFVCPTALCIFEIPLTTDQFNGQRNITCPICGWATTPINCEAALADRAGD